VGGASKSIPCFWRQNENVFFNHTVVTHRLVFNWLAFIGSHPLHVFFKVFLICLLF
jgi:hypothetical protein